MKFPFKVFRIINAFALTISLMLSFSAVSAVTVAGPNPTVVVMALACIACLFHSVYALFLQRTWIMPEIPLKQGTPGAVKFMGIIELIFAAFFILIGISILLMPENYLKDLIDQAKQVEEAYNVLTTKAIRQFGILITFIGILFTVNVFMSFRLLKLIRLRKPTRQDSASQQE
jgi:hypothetical protein